MRRLLMLLVIPSILAGCLVETRPRTVQPQYVARCPAGYRYDGYECRRIYAEPHHVEVQVR